MDRSVVKLPQTLLTGSLLLGCAALQAAAPAPVMLPPETVKLRPSDLPGFALANQKCGICHSFDYIAYQPPHMTQPQWTTEVTKMQHAYGAALTDDEVRIIGAYLAAAYGDASGVPATDAVPKASR